MNRTPSASDPAPPAPDSPVPAPPPSTVAPGPAAPASDPTPDADAQARALGRIADHVRGRGHRFRTFWTRVYWKADEDNIFFMAGAISFNVVVAIVPLILLVVGIAGYIVNARLGDPVETVTDLIFSTILPDVARDPSLVQGIQGIIDAILSGRGPLSFVGGGLLIWLSTRLVGTLRTALKEVFDIAHGRSIVMGKVFDAQMVVIGGVLILLNAGVTVSIRAARDYGVAVLGLDGAALQFGDRLLAWTLAFGSIWILFLLIYRFLPARSVPWRTALIAATVMAVGYEVMKQLFSWYVTRVADYGSTYGNLATLAVLYFWVYYNSIAFILSGEIAQVATMRRAWKYRPVALGGVERPVNSG